MQMRLIMPKYKRLGFLQGILKLFLREGNEVHYIGGTEVLPPPLEEEEETYCIQMLGSETPESARKKLIEHNLRLVVYIAKKFDNTGVGVEDLISIGTIGLIKGINTFNPNKNIKLATYASRCIENEILMHLRKNSKTKLRHLSSGIAVFYCLFHFYFFIFHNFHFVQTLLYQVASIHQ